MTPGHRLTINVDERIYDNAKVRRLAERLGIPRCSAVGHLAALWVWTAKHRPTGALSGLKAEQIAEASQWEGDCDDWLNALLSENLLITNGSELLVNDWDKWNAKGRYNRHGRLDFEPADSPRARNAFAAKIATSLARDAHARASGDARRASGVHDASARRRAGAAHSAMRVRNSVEKRSDSGDVPRNSETGEKKEKTVPKRKKRKSAHELLRQFVDATGNRANPRTIRSVERILKKGTAHALLLESAIERYAEHAKHKEKQYRILAHNFFGQQQRWLEFADIPTPESSPSVFATSREPVTFRLMREAISRRVKAGMALEQARREAHDEVFGQ